MSLGLPEFGSRGAPVRAGLWEVLRFAGLLALAYAVAMAAIEWRSESLAASSLQHARAQLALTRRQAEEVKGVFRRTPMSWSRPAASSPLRPGCFRDLQQVLPEGVFLVAVRIDYQPDTPARLDFSVVARTPEAYDRFLRLFPSRLSSATSSPVRKVGRGWSAPP